MRRPLVIGIGNPLRGDDGFGPAVIETLRREGLDAHVTLLSVRQLVPELVDEVQRASCVAFVDASAVAGPGEIVEVAVDAAPDASRWSHHLDPRRLAALAVAVAGAVPPARCFGVGAGGFEFGAELTEAARGRLAEVAERVRSWVGGPGERL